MPRRDDWSEFWDGRSGEDILEDVRADPGLLNATDRFGDTLLSTAIAWGELATARGLLSLGADPNTYASDGSWPLRSAIENNSLDAVRLLLEAGAHPTNPFLARGPDRPADVWWDTALCFAVLGRDIRIVEALIGAGADVNAGDDDNMTPLHVAAAAGNEAAVRLLLSAGADPNARDVQTAHTPAEWASSHGHHHVAALLR